MSLDDAKIAWKVLQFLFDQGYDHASEGLRALEGYVRRNYKEDPGDWDRYDD